MGSKVEKFYVELPTRHTVNTWYVIVELKCNPLTSLLLNLEIIINSGNQGRVNSSSINTLKITGNLQLLLLLRAPLPSINELLNCFKRFRSSHIPRLFWTFGCLNIYLKENLYLGRGICITQAVMVMFPDLVTRGFIVEIG